MSSNESANFSAVQKIEKNKMVTFDYILKDVDGKLIDESKGFEYLHGSGNLISGLEVALEGKTAGFSFSVTIAPKEAYGEYDEDLRVKVPREQFEKDAVIEKGLRFIANTAGGEMPVTVVEVGENEITIDGNHELAGKTLVFDIKITNVRDASDSEISLLTKSTCGSCTSCSSCHSESTSCGCSCNETSACSSDKNKACACE